jgi:hypothetical protein
MKISPGRVFPSLTPGIRFTEEAITSIDYFGALSVQNTWEMSRVRSGWLLVLVFAVDLAKFSTSNEFIPRGGRGSKCLSYEALWLENPSLSSIAFCLTTSPPLFQF